MSYKTVLVHVDESARASERIKIATAVAMAERAHLIGTATTGASRYLLQSRMQNGADPGLGAHLEFLHRRALQGLDDFEATAHKLGMPSFEKRLVDDEAGGGLCLQGRYADLLVIGQNDPDDASPVVMPDFPQYVVLNSGRPVLIVPFAGRFDNIGSRILVGWDASMEATRAIAGAMPLLRRAQSIEVATFNPQAREMQPEADIVPYLARHGIRIEVARHRGTQEVGDALLARAHESGADLIVMGGYGHARFREIVLGGVTRRALERMTVPVLMAH